jgi:hypothetical protein
MSNEHTHTSDCYQKALTCGNSDKDHTHTSACYTDVGPLCGYP